ncbi:MAG TPA: methionine synthase, partial [Anaerolineaceae bacterium]|nr:methionine synthase [Anaerolineaceae bacterium]
GENTVDPLTDPATLTKAVKLGIMDAPQLKNSAFAPGKITTRVVNGACEAVDAHGEPVSEQIRLEKFLN